MIIKDDGKGYETRPVLSNTEAVNNESLSGNGLKNMQERAHDIDAALNIESAVNRGTTIELKLKV